MAGTVTHGYFGLDVGKKINFNNEYIRDLMTFSQGHDIFFFCGKKIANNKKIGNYFHYTNTQGFFLNMIEYIKNNRLYDNPQVLAYLYGYINHYVLDKNIHPFVKYKTGKFRKKHKETWKYNGKHAEMESYIDSYMIYTREKILPGKLRIQKFCLNAHKFSNELLDLIDYTIKKTYDYDNGGRIYRYALNKMRFEFSLLRNDYFGIKKKIYTLADNILPQQFYKFAPVSLAFKPHSLDKYLNNHHKTWTHIMYKNEKYTTSFKDIYDDSIKEAIDIINKVNDYFKGKKVNLTKIFNNTSFTTGKLCGDKCKEQYFEY